MTFALNLPNTKCASARFLKLSGRLVLTTSHVATFSLVIKRGHPFNLSFTDKAMVFAVNKLKTKYFPFHTKQNF